MYFPAPGPDPNLNLPALVPNLNLPALVPNLYLLALAPNLYLPALAYIQFCYQSGAWVCIYQPWFTNFYLYLRSWPTIFITGPEPEYTFTLLLVVVAVNSSSSNFFGINNADFSKLRKTNWSVYACRLLCRFSVESNMFLASIRNRKWLENCQNQIMLGKRKHTSFAV